IAAHEGQLFGPLNQLLGLLTALGLLLLSVSGLRMWWRRRTPKTLGAPPPLVQPRIQATFVAMFLLLSLYIPMFGASALLVVLLERFVLSRNGSIRKWLSLGPGSYQDPMPQ
ncbi:MAG: PepSY domain-containing protein, partial [Pirellulaceae bacterium]